VDNHQKVRQVLLGLRENISFMLTKIAELEFVVGEIVDPNTPTADTKLAYIREELLSDIDGMEESSHDSWLSGLVAIIDGELPILEASRVLHPTPK